MAAWLAPVIQGVGALGQGLAGWFQGKENRRQAKWALQKQQEWATGEANKQWSRAMYAWDKSNNYNHPMMQMRRLKEAGLNPNMVYGNGSAAGLSSGPAPSYAKASTPDFQKVPGQPKGALFSAVSDALSSYQDFRMKDEVIKGKDIENDIASSESSVSSQYYYNRAQEQMYKAHGASDKAYQARMRSKYAPSLEEYNLQAKKAGVDAVKSRTTGQNLENDLNKLLKPYGITTKDNSVVRVILTIMQKENPDLNAVEAALMIPKMLEGIKASQHIINP